MGFVLGGKTHSCSPPRTNPALSDMCLVTLSEKTMLSLTDWPSQNAWALPLSVAALPGLTYGPLALHAAFLALGYEPSSLSELSQDPAIGNLLAESPQQIILGFPWFELDAHLPLLTTSLGQSPSGLVPSRTVR